MTDAQQPTTPLSVLVYSDDSHTREQVMLALQPLVQRAAVLLRTPPVTAPVVAAVAVAPGAPPVAAPVPVAPATPDPAARFAAQAREGDRFRKLGGPESPLIPAGSNGQAPKPGQTLADLAASLQGLPG